MMKSGACEGKSGITRRKARTIRVLQREFEWDLLGICWIFGAVSGKRKWGLLENGGDGDGAAIVECRLGEDEVKEPY